MGQCWGLSSWAVPRRHSSLPPALVALVAAMLTAGAVITVFIIIRIPFLLPLAVG